MKPGYIILIFVMLFSFSCKNEIEKSPKLPSIETFVVDFSYFQLNKVFFESQNNWEYVSEKVADWNRLITDSLSTPIASYVEAVNIQNPVYQGDDTWLWEYSFNNNKSIYTAKLFGLVEDESIYWEMYISKDGEYDDFKWFTGTSLNDESNVSWTIYKNPSDAIKLYSVEYNYVSDGVRNIRYVNLASNDKTRGNYIECGGDKNDDFDSFCNIYNKGLENLIEIQWSTINKKGRVKDEIGFQDSYWHCWDEDRDDCD